MTDGLPSWNAGAVKAAVLDFIARVTQPDGPDFVSEQERIATFDNDGTLWCEQPLQPQVFFLIDRVRQLVAADPAKAQQQPFKALIEQDHAALHALGKAGLQQLFFATHAGMTVEEFAVIARAWQADAKHPHLGTRFVDLVYQPQLELLALLRANGFRCFIVTGGGVEFVRAFSEDRYGVPPECVIGSSARLRFEPGPNGIGLYKLAELGSFNDREIKPANIGLHIGRRPILAFGNSDGDLAMLRYTLAGPGVRLGLLIHHDDADREFAYDRDFALSPLAEALDRAGDYGITLVSMQRDWGTVFPAS